MSSSRAPVWTQSLLSKSLLSSWVTSPTGGAATTTSCCCNRGQKWPFSVYTSTKHSWKHSSINQSINCLSAPPGGWSELSLSVNIALNRWDLEAPGGKLENIVKQHESIGCRTCDEYVEFNASVILLLLFFKAFTSNVVHVSKFYCSLMCQKFFNCYNCQFFKS